jgi:hypothetical protein
VRLPRISIASLCGLIALVALDCAWYRHTFLGSHSTFGFGKAPAFDTGVTPMANVLSLGVYLLVARESRPSPWLIGFEIGGLVAVVAFLVLGWTWPDGVRLWLRPIYIVWYYWSSGPMPRAYLYAADTVCFLPVELLIASGGGLLARLLLNRQGGLLRRISIRLGGPVR